jgi:hypothetical protein
MDAEVGLKVDLGAILLNTLTHQINDSWMMYFANLPTVGVMYVAK